VGLRINSLCVLCGIARYPDNFRWRKWSWLSVHDQFGRLSCRQRWIPAMAQDLDPEHDSRVSLLEKSQGYPRFQIVDPSKPERSSTTRIIPTHNQGDAPPEHILFVTGGGNFRGTSDCPASTWFFQHPSQACKPLDTSCAPLPNNYRDHYHAIRLPNFTRQPQSWSKLVTLSPISTWSRATLETRSTSPKSLGAD
jgi:hypothetical protein